MSDTAGRSSIETIATRTGSTASDIYAVLANERRQVLLDVLANRSTPIDVSTAARAVAVEASDGTADSVPSDQIEQTHAMLYHVHLPKLSDLGLIEYDADDDVVTEYVDGFEALIA